MEFIEDHRPGPPSGISQCNTARDEAEVGLVANRDANVLTGVESGLDSIRINASPELSIRHSISRNSSQGQIEPSPIMDLYTALHAARLEDPACKNQTYKTRTYIPVDIQRELITRECVLEILNVIRMPQNEHDPQSLADQILPSWPCSDPATAETNHPSRRKLFAILIMVGIPEKIFWFIQKGIWDSHLPFHRNWITNNWECRDSIDNGELFEVVDDSWEPNLKDFFEMYQWFLILPVFDMSGPELMHYSLYNDTLLPFTEDSPKDEKPVDGGFGYVRSVRIHPAHHNLAFQDRIYTVKRLESRSKVKFNREVEALRLLRNHDDPHLIQLLTTYHDGKHYNLIFPWANDNLKGFWRQNPVPEKSYRTSMWIVEQCSGIAEALRKIHYCEFLRANNPGPEVPSMKGRHGDITPQNILWFPSSNGTSGGTNHGQGILALSDYGLTRFHKPPTLPIRKYQHLQAVSSAYRAPEFDLGKEASPLWDIWNLGYVYLEFLIWYLQGWDAVDAFSEQRKKCDSALDLHQRKYFSSGRQLKYGAYQKLPVIWRIRELHKHPNCTDFIHEFLNLIANNMIRTRPQKRMDSTAISKRTREMLEVCKNGRHIVLSQRPRPSWRERQIG